jgi:hypothetical protein
MKGKHQRSMTAQRAECLAADLAASQERVAELEAQAIVHADYLETLAENERLRAKALAFDKVNSELTRALARADGLATELDEIKAERERRFVAHGKAIDALLRFKPSDAPKATWLLQQFEPGHVVIDSGLKRRMKKRGWTADDLAYFLHEQL